MIIRDYITLTEVTDGPAYRHRGVWAFSKKTDYYEWGGAGQQYVDTVIHNGSLFVATAENASANEPPSIPMSSSYWDILIAKGYTEDELRWSGENVNIELVTSLYKNGGTEGIMDGRAISLPQYAGNAFAVFTIENTKSDYVAAFGDYQPECGVHIANGILYEIQKGEEIQVAQSSLVTGDQIGLEYQNGFIYLYKNGVVISSYSIDNKMAKFKLIFTIATITTIPIISGIKFGTYVPYIDWIQEWDGTKTLIGDSYIVSPKAFLGQNNTTEEEPVNLTGVALGVGINGLSDGTTGLAGYNQNKQTFIIRTDGSADFGIDGETSSKFSILRDGRALIKNLNASEIKYGRLVGGLIDAKGLTVTDSAEQETFIITNAGDVFLKGEIKSLNFVDDNSKGYALLADGKAILNEAIIRGSVMLPNAGITNYGDLDSDIRIWAGASYEAREKASFRVTHSGDLYAKRGTFGGKVAAEEIHTETIHMINGSFIINNTTTTLDPAARKIMSIAPKTEETYIKFEKSGSIINSDLVMGTTEDKRIEFLKNARALNIQGTNMSITGGSVKVTIDRSTDWSKALSIGSMIATHDARFSIGYSTSDKWTNTLIVSGNGTKSVSDYGDICFRRNNTRENLDVNIVGNLKIKKSLTSSEHDIEMRGVPNEGWGFYII